MAAWQAIGRELVAVSGMMARRNALVVADDLTGAMDTGTAFAARGFETVVRHDPSFDADSQVLVVDTDSRYEAPEVARNRVHDIVSAVDAGLVYKKIDSTLRGNVGTETVAAANAMEADVAVVTPAFPSNERVTADGYHLVHGRPIADTEPGNDPKSPIGTSHLPTFLQDQVDAPVVHVSIFPVATNAIIPHLRPTKAPPRNRLRLITFDAVHDSHLDTIAGCVEAIDEDVLLVGSGGLAEYVRIPGTPSASHTPLRETPRGRAFGVAGSTDSTTRSQLDHLDEQSVVELDTVHAIREPHEAAKAAASECLDRFRDCTGVVLASALDEDTVDRTLAAARNTGVSENEMRQRIELALATTADHIWTAARPDGLFLTGGAVAKVVLDQLGAGGITLRGEEVGPGIPVGVVRDGRADGTPLITKAGAFGDTTTIADALEMVRRVPHGND